MVNDINATLAFEFRTKVNSALKIAENPGSE